MIKPSITLQELRRRIYRKAKAEKQWRFWGLYVHVCKMETLRAAYREAKANHGAPGIDGVSFESIEVQGVEKFLENIQKELVARTYRPTKNRRIEIPKGGGKTRRLGIPTIKDRIVEGAVKLILEPIFEADFYESLFSYRPKRTAHQALDRVVHGLVRGLTQVIDIDLKSYFDNIRHHIVLLKLEVTDMIKASIIAIVLTLSVALCAANSQAQPVDVAAAKKEGRVVVYGSVVPQAMEELHKNLETKYDIKVEYWRGSSTAVAERPNRVARGPARL